MNSRVAIITGKNLSDVLTSLLGGRGGEAIRLMGPGNEAFEDAFLAECINEYSKQDMMVPRAGIEPALLSEPHFECGASTSSANGATSGEQGLYHGLAYPRKTQSEQKQEDAFEVPMDAIDKAALDALEAAYGFRPTPWPAETIPHYTQYELRGLDERTHEETVRIAMMMSMEQRLFADRLVKLRDNLTLPGSLDVVFKFDTRGYFYAQIVDLDGLDNVTCEPLEWRGRKWLLSMHKKDSEIIQTVFKALMTAMEHELREQFPYKDAPVLDPHLDLEKLVELRKQADSTSKRA